MSEDRSSNGQKSWLGKLTQAFAHEPKNRQELLELLRDAHQNKLLDSEALAIVEGAIQVADLQVRDIMVPRSQMVSIKATQTPREFLPAVVDSAHSRYPGCEIYSPRNSPSQPKKDSIPSINGAAQANTAWKITNIITARLSKPNTGCRKILSRKSVRLSS